MRTLPLRARVYVVGIVAAAAALLAAFATLPPPSERHLFIGLTTATIGASAL